MGHYEIRPIQTGEKGQLSILLRQQLEEELALFEKPYLLTHFKTSDDTIARLAQFWESEANIEVFCVTADKQIEGFVAAQLKPDIYNDQDVISGEILAIYVAKNHRGKGLGSALLKQAEKWFSHHSAYSINVSWLNGNRASQKLYENFGFAPVYTTGRKILNETD